MVAIKRDDVSQRRQTNASKKEEWGWEGGASHTTYNTLGAFISIHSAASFLSLWEGHRKPREEERRTAKTWRLLYNYKYRDMGGGVSLAHNNKCADGNKMPLFGTHMKFPFVFPFIISSCTRTKKDMWWVEFQVVKEGLRVRKPHDSSPTVSNLSYSQIHTHKTEWTEKITTSAGTPNAPLLRRVCSQLRVFPPQAFWNQL